MSSRRRLRETPGTRVVVEKDDEDQSDVPSFCSNRGLTSKVEDFPRTREDVRT